jgi:hypothetical protein
MRHGFGTPALTVLFGLVAAAQVTWAAATEPPVTVVSPCECQGAHGKGRWVVKNDPSTPPTDTTVIQSTTPSQMFNWSPIGVQLDWQSERTGIEDNWYALTGRVVGVKVEADGDLIWLCKMRLAIRLESWCVKCQQALNGAKYATPFSVGPTQDFRCTFSPRENSRSMEGQSLP